MSKKTIAVRLSSHEALVRIAADLAKESGKRVTLDEALAHVLAPPVVQISASDIGESSDHTS